MVLPTPVPCNVIAFESVTRVVQANAPAGNVMVSPFCASASWMYCTFVVEPSESYTVANADQPLQISVVAALVHPTRDLNMPNPTRFGYRFESIDANDIRCRH
jgi:hypothetical protein